MWIYMPVIHSYCCRSRGKPAKRDRPPKFWPLKLNLLTDLYDLILNCDFVSTSSESCREPR